MNELRLAFAFLTRLPVGAPKGGARENAIATRFFPLVGVALALLVFGVHTLGARLFDEPVAAILALLTWSAVTGGLHLDGLADCVDGLAVTGTASRRLQVMHDPRIGGLGAAAVAGWMMLKAALLVDCAAEGTIVPALWTALILARTPLGFELAEGEPATPGHGLFAWLHPELRRVDWVTAIVLGTALMAPLVSLGMPMVVRAGVGALLAAVSTLAWHLGWYRRVGGLTGDILGAAVELREVVILAAMGAHLHG